MTNLFPIVFEDSRLLVINKPAGLVCHPTKGDEYSSLVGRLRLYLGAPGHLINRLDRETSGLVLVAKTPQAKASMTRAWASRAVHKIYLAIVRGYVPADTGSIDASLGKDVNATVAIKDCVRDDGAAALTHFKVRRRFQRRQGDFSLLEVRPETGRKHQIRIHLAHIGHPIVGDKLYGGDEMLYLDFARGRLTAEQSRRLILPNQALHAALVTVAINRLTMTFLAEPERDFQSFAGIS